MHKRFRRLLRRQIDRFFWLGRPHFTVAMEPVYQQIVQRDLAYLGVRDRFYPLNAAANYSFMYIVIRACIDFEIRSVLELGAGQSTLLLNDLRKVGAIKGDVITLEHDARWVDSISPKVCHHIIRSDLVPKTCGGISFQGYDFSVLGTHHFDLVLIDGPPAWPSQNRFSRVGAEELVRNLDPLGFIIVIDDAGREGEILLLEKLRENLRKGGIKYAVGHVEAAKQQAIVAGGKYMDAAYY